MMVVMDLLEQSESIEFMQIFRASASGDEAGGRPSRSVLVATSWRHTGYIMLIYLAGLKGVDASLREAAAVDGAGEVKTFFHVILPVMRPINLIVLVIVVIESLRAFDLVWIINKGRNGLELISALVSQNVIGEATRYGFGSALAVIMMLISSVFITIYLRIVFQEERR